MSEVYRNEERNTNVGTPVSQSKSNYYILAIVVLVLLLLYCLVHFDVLPGVITKMLNPSAASSQVPRLGQLGGGVTNYFAMFSDL